MTLAHLRGNGNRAVWRDVALVDGALYRLPSGQLVLASVVPHPDALPAYWRDTPDGRDAWPTGRNLTLSLRWAAKEKDKDRIPGAIGPAQVTLFAPASVAGVPWGEDFYVHELDATPVVLPAADGAHDAHDDTDSKRGWPVGQLTPARAEDYQDFAAQVQAAEMMTMERLAETRVAA